MSRQIPDYRVEPWRFNIIDPPRHRLGATVSMLGHCHRQYRIGQAFAGHNSHSHFQYCNIF